MKIVARTKKDFEWVNWSVKKYQELVDSSINKTKEDIERIKSVVKSERNFENTVAALDTMGLPEEVLSSISLLSYVSPKKEIRERTAKMIVGYSSKIVDVLHDEGLYKAFLEYKPKNLSLDQKRLYMDHKKSFEKMGFHLSSKDQKKLKSIKKEISRLEQQAQFDINKARETILCSREELDGMDKMFISSLKRDKKTGKYIVSTDYPDLKPFLRSASNAKKRKELSDKSGKIGGLKNIKRLERLIVLRNDLAKLIGYKDHASLVLDDRVAKTEEAVVSFLDSNLKELMPLYAEKIRRFEKIKSGKLQYFDQDFYLNEFIKEDIGIDENEIKEYFLLENVLDKMFKTFSSLFSISFSKNMNVKLWDKDVFLIDVLENKKVVAQLILDLHPREGKYGHACHWALNHGHINKKGEYDAPLSVLICNFPKTTKKTPGLLDILEVDTIFHEFGHACHSLLTRARYVAQSGTSTKLDFVETPSQLFEMWLSDKDYLRSISSHYKTGESIGSETVDKILFAKKIKALFQNYRTFVLAMFDISIHSNPGRDIFQIRNKILKKYRYIKVNQKSFFPSNFGHMYGGYDVGYYSYMWSLVYSYDIFSRFEKEGIMNKKVGMELRRKILEKGDSEDPIKLMKDFLGRKPNNKAFLKAIK